ncbi:MAG: GNAT family N-acetyltransferase [Clostridia bacterium]|nr:GNAT family N-acetyltransferase [Clostridia bacterium]
MVARKAIHTDIDKVLKIYERARQYMADTGNPTQWADFYPPEELVMKDFDGGNLYVLEEDGELCGVFAFFPDGDPVYQSINGAWLNSLPHGAIHRIAASGTKKGVLSACVDYCLTQTNNLKIDTHKSNKVMQNALTKCGFVYCGTVTVPYLNECIAFQLYRE